MAWSEKAREAAAEARRRKAKGKTQGAFNVGKKLPPGGKTQGAWRVANTEDLSKKVISRAKVPPLGSAWRRAREIWYNPMSKRWTERGVWVKKKGKA